MKKYFQSINTNQLMFGYIPTFTADMIYDNNWKFDISYLNTEKKIGGQYNITNIINGIVRLVLPNEIKKILPNNFLSDNAETIPNKTKNDYRKNLYDGLYLSIKLKYKEYIKTNMQIISLAMNSLLNLRYKNEVVKWIKNNATTYEEETNTYLGSFVKAIIDGGIYTLFYQKTNLNEIEDRIKEHNEYAMINLQNGREAVLYSNKYKLIYKSTYNGNIVFNYTTLIEKNNARKKIYLNDCLVSYDNIFYSQGSMGDGSWSANKIIYIYKIDFEYEEISIYVDKDEEGHITGYHCGESRTRTITTDYRIEIGNNFKINM